MFLYANQRIIKVSCASLSLYLSMTMCIAKHLDLLYEVFAVAKTSCGFPLSYVVCDLLGSLRS